VAFAFRTQPRVTLVEPTQEEQTWALMAYLGQFVLAGLAPLVVLMLRGRSPYVRRHAAQSLNLAISVFAVWIAGGLLSLAASWLLVVPIGYAAASIVCLVRAAMAANRLGWYQIPAAMAWPILK